MKRRYKKRKRRENKRSTRKGITDKRKRLIKSYFM
jgi:hypothetical protein